MVDFVSTKSTASFEEWFEQVALMAEINGHNAGDKSRWEVSYNAGMPVDVAYYDTFGSD